MAAHSRHRRSAPAGHGPARPSAARRGTGHRGGDAERQPPSQRARRQQALTTPASRRGRSATLVAGVQLALATTTSWACTVAPTRLMSAIMVETFRSTGWPRTWRSPSATSWRMARRGSVSLGALKAVPISSRVPAGSRNEAASTQDLPDRRHRHEQPGPAAAQ